MFARVSTYKETHESIAAGLARSSEVTKKVQGLPGFKGLYYLVDPDAGQSISVTLWETEQAMLETVEQANQIRTDETEARGGQIVDVAHYEVALAHVG